jgi:hypothetical protein
MQAMFFGRGTMTVKFAAFATHKPYELVVFVHEHTGPPRPPGLRRAHAAVTIRRITRVMTL